LSELRANTISAADGTSPATLTGQSASKAWVRFNGEGTVAINEDSNVSSLTDNGTGDYTVSFGNGMATATYGLAGGSGDAGGTVQTTINYFTTPLTTSVDVALIRRDGALQDQDLVSVIVFGDLA
jgi:hypothetical protein